MRPFDSYVNLTKDPVNVGGAGGRLILPPGKFNLDVTTVTRPGPSIFIDGFEIPTYRVEHTVLGVEELDPNKCYAVWQRVRRVLSSPNVFSVDPIYVNGIPTGEKGMVFNG